MATEVAVVQLSRARRIWFYTVVGLALALVVFGLGELLYLGVVGWLGESAFEAATEPGAGMHLFHVLAHGLFAWILLISIAVQLRHPAQRFALSIFALAAMATYSLGTLVSGIFDPLEVVAIVLLVAAVWLNPGRGGAGVTPVYWTAFLAAVPVVVGATAVAVVEVGRQLSAVSADEHAEFGHYGLVAAMALIVVIAAFIGATSLSGRRLVAALAVASLLYIGVASILFDDQMSSLGTVWGVGALAAGLLYGWGAMGSRPEKTS